MKLDDIEHDYDLVMEMILIDSSDRHDQLPITLVENTQLFVTKQRLYFWSMFYNYLLLFLKVFINTWLSRIMPNILSLHHRGSNYCINLLIRLCFPAISPNPAFAFRW